MRSISSRAQRLALAEGLAFAERLGLDSAAFLEVARGSAAYSKIMDVKGERMVRRAFAPKGSARQTLKDVQLMREQARAVACLSPLWGTSGFIHRTISSALRMPRAIRPWQSLVGMFINRWP